MPDHTYLLAQSQESERPFSQKKTCIGFLFLSLGLLVAGGLCAAVQELKSGTDQDNHEDPPVLSKLITLFTVFGGTCLLITLLSMLGLYCMKKDNDAGYSKVAPNRSATWAGAEEGITTNPVYVGLTRE